MKPGDTNLPASLSPTLPVLPDGSGAIVGASDSVLVMVDLHHFFLLLFFLLFGGFSDSGAEFTHFSPRFPRSTTLLRPSSIELTNWFFHFFLTFLFIFVPLLSYLAGKIVIIHLFLIILFFLPGKQQSFGINLCSRGREGF